MTGSTPRKRGGENPRSRPLMGLGLELGLGLGLVVGRHRIMCGGARMRCIKTELTTFGRGWKERVGEVKRRSSNLEGGGCCLNVVGSSCITVFGL